ncbi:MAG: hypothetical protein OXQ90_02925 [Gammaproteobacteria bacterium]|nr:hypothetical protein [Gammaproteobacteria bacterium]
MGIGRCILVVVFALCSLAVYAGEAPEERTEETDPPADEQRRAEPSAGEREGLAPRREEPGPKEPGPKEPAAQTRVSLEDATAIVRQAYGGRVVSAAAATARPARSRPKESGHRVRVDVDGRVKTVFVDARGRIHENAEY